jgi:hypothetical protein
VGAVDVAFGLEIGAQFGVVVDFSVVDDPNILFLVGERLLAGFYVDDAQTPHRQANILLYKITFIIGAAMHDAAIHRRQSITPDAPISIVKEYSADSTHRNFWRESS